MIGTAVDQNCAARLSRSTLERGGGNSVDSIVVAAFKENEEAAESVRAGGTTNAFAVAIKPTANNTNEVETFILVHQLWNNK